MTIDSTAGPSSGQQQQQQVAATSSNCATVIADHTDGRQARPSKLKSLLQLAAQLNPFANQQVAEPSPSKRRQSLDQQEPAGLLALARRYLRPAEGPAGATRSAPATPAKQRRPNGCQARPSVRFAEAADAERLVAELFPEAAAGAAGEAPMSLAKFRQHGYKLIDYICHYLETIGERRVTPLNIEPGYLKSLIAEEAPQLGEPFSAIMRDFEKHIMCGITHWQHPHFHAYFPAGNAFPSILADMLSDGLGCVGFSWAASPAYTELEVIMLDWMGKLIGLPEQFLLGENSKGGGVIQGSASECVLVALLAARHQAIERLRTKLAHLELTDGQLLERLIGYCSREAHSCVEKAAMIGFIKMRALDTDQHLSLRGETLRAAMEADRAQGLEPFIVVATLGTTSCASFDQLDELGQVCQELDEVWLHVDAAYAGSALICPEFKQLARGLHRAHSFNTNPNKWMLINFDCSLLWVRDRFKLTRTFVVDPLYLQHSFSDQAIDYRHWGVPLSRRFRSLKLWFVIRNYGAEGLRAYVRNHVRLAKLFERLIRQDARFTIDNQVTLGLVCFRLKGSNALNQRLLSNINASGKLHMVPASLKGKFVIRFCVCEQNARDESIRYAYLCIAEAATELLASVAAGRERLRAISQQNTIDQQSVGAEEELAAAASASTAAAAAAGEAGQQQVEAAQEAASEEEEAAILQDFEQDFGQDDEQRRLSSSAPEEEQWRSTPVEPRAAELASSWAASQAAEEAKDELYTMARRRQRMSLRYKREFFVRVVSDPRVYRASVSGDINGSHASLANAPARQPAAGKQPPAPDK